jgi:hypothetical protein
MTDVSLLHSAPRQFDSCTSLWCCNLCNHSKLKRSIRWLLASGSHPIWNTTLPCGLDSWKPGHIQWRNACNSCPDCTPGTYVGEVVAWERRSCFVIDSTWNWTPKLLISFSFPYFNFKMEQIGLYGNPCDLQGRRWPAGHLSWLKSFIVFFYSSRQMQG